MKIVYLGCCGFPYGLSEIQKMILISKSLISTGNHVTIVCSTGIHSKFRYPELKPTGFHENIEYIYTSGYPFRHHNFLKRNFLKIKGIINEVNFIKRQKEINKLDISILSTDKFSLILFYFVLSKLYGFKTILNYVEYYSGIKKKWYHIGKWINDKLYDNYTPLMVDAVFPISEFLIDHLKKVSPSTKYMKIPILTDFNRYDGIENSINKNYFLFCGASNYIEVIQFIIDSFCRLNSKSIFLYLVINGDENEILKIKDNIKKSLYRNQIKLFSNLTEKQLNSYYKNAMALLIPLRPTIQDIARFPHKIGEYLASGNPVISTNYGEVKFYFKDMDSMLIAESYDINLFCEKMQEIINNPLKAKIIGIKGKKIALSTFDYRIQATNINDFLKSM